MGIIVFFVIVVCIVVSNAKKTSSVNERSRQQRQQMQQMQQRQYGQRPYVPGNPQQPYTQNRQYAGQSAQQTAMPQGQYRTQQQPVRPVNQTGQIHTQTSSGSQAAGNVSKQQSTLDYLEQKARADQVQHQKEMREDAMRRERASEGRNMGGRYMNGDPVPQGARLCKCGYCGAENVVSAYSGNKYKCYFCWENII